MDLSRNEFQQLLKQQVFTREQVDFVHDMRRRSKNRLAARRCRKRKLDCIHNLQCEINKLVQRRALCTIFSSLLAGKGKWIADIVCVCMCVQKAEKEKLMVEKSQLGQLKMKTCDNVSALCQKVCKEASLQPQQLQVLAKYTSPECPLSSIFPHIDTLLLQHGPQPQTSQTGWAVESQEPSSEENNTSSLETLKGDCRHLL